jgi:hypothetical protein
MKISTPITITLDDASQERLILVCAKLTTTPDDLVSVLLEQILGGRKMPAMVGAALPRRQWGLPSDADSGGAFRPLSPDEDDSLPPQG